jgi:hypothetical protein
LSFIAQVVPGCSLIEKYIPVGVDHELEWAFLNRSANELAVDQATKIRGGSFLTATTGAPYQTKSSAELAAMF